MRTKIAMSFLTFGIVVVFQFGIVGNHTSAQPDIQALRFSMSGTTIEITAEAGRLTFQRLDASLLPAGEPWFWPEEPDSPLRYEEPRLVESSGETWLLFLERGADGTARSRAISLSDVFADGFETGNTAAWSSTEPAVNLFIESPLPLAAVGDATPTIRVRYETPTGLAVAPETLAIQTGGGPLAVSCTSAAGGAECVPTLPFADGPVAIEARVADVAGNLSPVATRQFAVDTAAPAISLSSPAEGFLTAEDRILVAGSLSETAELRVGVTAIPLANDLSFSALVPLEEGSNLLELTATDPAGNAATASRSGILDTVPPAPVSAARVSTRLEGANVSIAGAAGAAEAGALVRWRNLRTGQEAKVSVAPDGSFATSLPAAEGDLLAAVVIDFADRRSAEAYFPLDYQVPPDPTPFAPPLDPTVAYDLGDAISFLYQGENAIQEEVAPGAIEERRIGWLRGTVRQRGGAPLPGVKVTALGHPELGYTLTRADGVFDLVVNGGGVVTLDFERPGFLPVQQQEKMGWRESVVIDDVVMLGLDSVSTTIVSESPNGQIARSTRQVDDTGSREAVLFFPPGTAASLRLPSGSQPLVSLTVRATEYTVGEDGPLSMPGPLPDNVAYTYAVELSADEAIAARAEHVDFSQPVYLYLDSFIPIPVGSAVPVGWYDYRQAAWIPSDDGRVIEILAGRNGLAEIDADGSGSPAGPETLAELGFTDAERQALATLYPPGQQLWRAPIAHFSPRDMNFPYSPPDDAETPPEPVVKTNDDEPEGDQHDDDGSDEDESDSVPVTAEQDPVLGCGSILECENQIVRQRIPITGTPYQLSYSTHRTPGWGSDLTFSLEVRGATVPDSLKQIRMELDGNGVARSNSFRRSEFESRPFLSQQFRLSEFDPFGRPVTGQRRFRARLGFGYRLALRSSEPEFARSWARYAEADAQRTEVSGDSRGIVFWRESRTTYNQVFRSTLGRWDGRAQKLGGFTIDVHHAYDPVARTLHLGDGSQRSAVALSPTLHPIAGTGAQGYGGDGGPALLADLDFPGHLAVGPDGSVFVSDIRNFRIRVVRPDGLIETVAGSGIRCLEDGSVEGEEPSEGCDDGVPATAARLNEPGGLAVAADGSLFFADVEQECVYRVDPQGILHVVAGICRPRNQGGGHRQPTVTGFGEAGPATEIELSRPNAVAVKSDGTLFIADSQGLGQVTTDGRFARVLQLEGAIDSMAAGDNGDLYLLDSFFGKIYRLDAGGELELIAGGGGNPGLDGNVALDSYFVDLGALAFGRDGRLYFLEGGSRIRRLEADGTVKTVGGPQPVEGEDSHGYPETGNFLLENRFQRASGLAFGIDDRLLVSDAAVNQVFETRIAYPDYLSEDLLIAEGGQVLVFDRRGRHLETRHGITGAVVHSFQYDPQGLLIAIADGDGNLTTIERDGSGQATAIVSPFGQRTALVMDEDGWLESIENPAKEKHSFAYQLGLMIEKVDPRGFHKFYEYSDLGRLTAAVDEEGQRKSFGLMGRFGFPDHTVIQEDADGQSTHYTVRRGADGSLYRSQLDADGLKSKSQRTRDGGTSNSQRGVTGYLKSRPDPRLGETAAYPAITSLRMSEFLASESRSAISASLEDPNDRWSFPELTSISSTNGRVTSSVFTAASRNFTTVSPEGRAVSLDLDALARPIRFEGPDTEPWSASYRDSGELEEIVVGSEDKIRRTLFGYDELHRLETVEDAEERIVSFGYDGANRVTSTNLPDGKAVGFVYDDNGNVTQVTPPGRPAHVFTYTPRNQLQTYVLPDAGSGTAVEERIYDHSKRLEEVRRPDGKVIAFEYKDGSDRLEKIVSPRGDTSFGYNTVNGLVAEIEEPDGQKLSFEYEGVLLKRTIWTGEVNGSVERTYDESFRVKTLSVNGENPIEYTYDDDNLLVQVGEMTITRDPESGRELTTQLGNVTTARTYSSFGEPETYTAKFGETEIYFERLTYNKLGWITDLERRQNGWNENLHYEYDDRGRLEEVWRDGNLESSYTFDDNSNRLSYAGPLGNATGTYDERDRMLTYGDATYTWTETGELLTKTEGGETTTYDYDVFGNLRKVELPSGIEIEYLTDGAQRRIGKKVNGVLVKQWLYQDQLEPVAELDGAGNITKRFTYGTISYVPDFLSEPGGTVRFISDYLGSPRLLLDTDSGLIMQEVRLNEFGVRLLDTNPAYQEVGLAGGMIDNLTGLVRFGLRDLDPRLGRWQKRDPLGFYSDQTNLWIYVGNNPQSFIDPIGLYFGLDDGIFTAGGAVLGLLGQAGADLVAGKASGWEDYLASAVGGAIGGEALLYTGPVGAGVAAGLSTNLLKQFLKNQTGKQCGYDLVSLAADSALGGATGLIPGMRVPGITAGRGSYLQVYRQMVTKAQRGTAQSVTLGTAGKMYVGRGVETALPQGVVVSGMLGGSGWLPDPGVSCSCSE
jgi:RHS repeat-associated protein